MSNQSTNVILACCRDDYEDHALHCLNPGSGVVVREFTSPSSSGSGSFNASQTSSSEFVTCGGDGEICLGSMTSRDLLCMTNRGHHGQDIRGVATVSSGKRIATGGDDNRIRLWDIDGSALRELSQIEGHTDSLTQLCHHPTLLPTSLYSASEDSTVREWDLEKGAALRVFRGHSRRCVHALCMDSVHHLIISGSDDNKVVGWDNRTGEIVLSIPSKNYVRTVLFREESNQLIVPEHFGRINAYDLRMFPNQRIAGRFWEHMHTGSVYGSCDVPDQKVFVTTGKSQVKAWREDGTLVWEYTPRNCSLYRALSFIHDY